MVKKDKAYFREKQGKLDALPKIKFSKGGKPKSVPALIEKFFTKAATLNATGRFIEIRNKVRTVDDFYRIMSYYFPDTTFKECHDLLKALTGYLGAPILKWKCIVIHRTVYELAFHRVDIMRRTVEEFYKNKK